MSTESLALLLLWVAAAISQGTDDWNYTDYDDEVFRQPPHYKLEKFLMNNYNKKLIPKRHLNESVQVKFSIELYQIIEVNEPQQYILMNAWIVERWRDDMLYWNPAQFEGIKEIILPKDEIWIPDTTLYNSLVMNDAESRRLLNAKLTTDTYRKTVLVELLYPTLYKFSCMLDLRFFPFDVQACKMTFGSWTYDKNSIDYFPHNDSGKTDGTNGIGTKQCIENEGWNILGTRVRREEMKYDCCANNYTLLEFYLHIQRKPLFYLINLIAPTSVITLIAIVGFFSSSTINDMREEKISLGITTLLSMSILIFMVSDQMPSTSSFIPLIGWFYTCMMMLISGGTLCASMVIYAQKKGILGHRPTSRTMRWARWLGKVCMMEMPLVMKEAYAVKAKQDKLKRQAAGQRKQSIWQRWQKIGRDISRLSIPSMHTQSTIMTADNSFTSISLKRVAAEPPPDLATLASKIVREMRLQKAKKLQEMEVAIQTESGAQSEKTDQSETLPSEDLDDCSYQQISDDDKSSCMENGWKHGHIIHKKPTVNRPRKNVGLVRKGSSFDKDCRGCNNTVMSRQRNLAELEYDWLAAVIERCFLIIFCVLFFFFSFGINGIGMYYWWNATVDGK
uniref:Neur_chan_LBD domain-containing protein n=1 Tax=Steinernema glaseri TaxID=37863 RepID=A0A1I8A6X9_9BILA